MTLDEEDNIVGFLGKKDFKFSDISNYYKTVNILQNLFLLKKEKSWNGLTKDSVGIGDIPV